MRRLWLVGFLILGVSACSPPFGAKNESDVILRVTNITATAGGNGTGGETLLSDVTPVFNDNATVTIEAIPKNSLVEELGQFNDVQLTNYAVRYIRSDGRGIEGVDVPWSISGNLNIMVPAGGEATANFIVVRHQAKLEPPLQNLGALGGFDIVTVSAEITIYGRTTSGKAVSAKGYLEIVFTDFADA